MSKNSNFQPENNPKDWQKFKDEHEQVASDELEAEELTQAHREESALEHPSYLALEEKLTLAEQQAHENWEKSVRALAELENVRRRTEREIANAHRFGVEKIVQNLLPVMDSLEQALQLASQKEDSSMEEGLTLTIKLFLDALTKVGVNQIDPVGLPFDPQKHEAMSIQVIPDAPPNSVVMVFQKGYELNERVVRPARVIVAKTEG